MNKKKLWVLAAILVIICGACVIKCHYCNNDHAVVTTQYIPQSPDYSDTTMWITKDCDLEGTGADVFYVVSTWEKDWMTADSTVCHYADVWNPTHRERMAIEINRVAAYMAPGNRFYAPFYRHATIEAFETQNEDTVYHRTRLAMEDVCEAFDHFQAHRDQKRPLIIAGFSQGGLAVVELLKHMDDETYSQLAAAYVLGYKVTPEDTLQTKHIKAAQGETDTGVTICYNTVKDVKYIKPVIGATCMGINPVNWRIDATPATLHDTITVTLSPEYHVLVVNGYSGSEYKPYKDLLNVGDIHSCEPWLYSECLKKNIAVRARAWKNRCSKVRGVRGTLDGPTTDMPMPDLSEIHAAQWLTAIVMHGTGVHVEQLYQIEIKEGRAYVAETIDPYDVQQAFCQRLGYTIEGKQITLYLDQEPVATVTNTVTDMGGFDDDAIWVGEQISYDLRGKKPRVCMTPGVKFVVGLMLHYDDMPTFTASITMSDGTINLSDIKIEN